MPTIKPKSLSEVKTELSGKTGHYTITWHIQYLYKFNYFLNTVTESQLLT
jgi:hypothetical protein